MTKDEALMLADAIEDGSDIYDQAANELRRLHGVNEELLAALKQIVDIKNESYGPDWEEIASARKIARSAIRKGIKATGETE